VSDELSEILGVNINIQICRLESVFTAKKHSKGSGTSNNGVVLLHSITEGLGIKSKTGQKLAETMKNLIRGKISYARFDSLEVLCVKLS
jgi:hypothetical protein